MKKRKKVLIIVIVSVLLFLSGCGKAVETSETVRWFNASNALLINLNQWDYQKYGGLKPNPVNQEIVKAVLDDSWDVTDKESAQETLDWLLAEGQRMVFDEDMRWLDEIGLGEISPEKRVDFLMANLEINEEQAQFFAGWYDKYEKYGIDASSGWDYNRALSQLANFYLAGYFTQEEALDASLEVAKTIQEHFDSWDDYMESYFAGYEYWAEESSEERRAIYEELKNAEDNPYSIDFKTTLEKSW